MGAGVGGKPRAVGEGHLLILASDIQKSPLGSLHLSSVPQTQRDASPTVQPGSGHFIVLSWTRRTWGLAWWLMGAMAGGERLWLALGSDLGTGRLGIFSWVR